MIKIKPKSIHILSISLNAYYINWTPHGVSTDVNGNVTKVALKYSTDDGNTFPYTIGPSEINTSDYHSWACLRPMTPNMMPIVKKSTKNKKVFYHAGHGHLGWTLAAATAEKLAEQIYESTQSI
jgi:hypothetical protein